MKKQESGAKTPTLPPVLAGDAVCLYRSTKPLGDALFLTTAAREIRRRNPSARITIRTHWPGVFANNPDIASVAGIRDPFTPPKGAIPIVYEDPWPPISRRHVLEIITGNLGLKGVIEIRPYFYPKAEERRLAAEMRPRNGRPLVVVHPFSGFFAARTKQWNFAHWKKLLEILPPGIETVRFSDQDEPATPTERTLHRDILGADLRVIAALLESADAFVGQDSGLAHLATALGVPAVVIFTGYVPPDMFGYPQNINLAPDLPYIPCWCEDGCPPCKGEICTRAVQPEKVLESILKVLEEKGRWRK
jgi:ADP-heptose:LPS heptosyltransferase